MALSSWPLLLVVFSCATDRGARSTATPTPAPTPSPPETPTSPTRAGVPQIYVGVRTLGSEAEIRTRVTGREQPVSIDVPGSRWSCTYQRLFVSQPVPGHPRSARYAERLHALDCRAGELGASVSLSCAEALDDFQRELGHRQRLAEPLALVEQLAGREVRTFVTLSCE